MDFIGWYTTGDAPGVMDIKVHKQICEINESPIMLKLNPYDKNIEVSITLHGKRLLKRFLDIFRMTQNSYLYHSHIVVKSE